MSQFEKELPAKPKTFIPLENNPTVLTHLSHTLGLPPHLTYHDIYSLTPLSPTILRPAHALVLIVQASVYHRARDAEFAAQAPYTGHGDQEPVFWAKQTIGHACGFMSVLHALANGHARTQLKSDSVMMELIGQGTPLDPQARSQLLYDSPDVEAAHMAAARMGDTVVPSSEDPNGFHFITFVKGGDGGLWELNGGMKGPVCRGVLGEGEDVLSERALEWGVKGFLKEAGSAEVGFSLVALAGRGL
ncbi:hypothetical protein ACLMJK_008678 [Lecanora helva]